MSTLGMVELLFVALGLVMTGLGLSLHPRDFVRLKDQKRDVVVALALQMVVLPAVVVAMTLATGLTGIMAAGFVLLAATPGSISANLFSHLFGGRVAFNVALTGLNTVLCVFTLPLLTGWSLAYFTGSTQLIPILYARAMQTILLVLVPVLVGMGIAAKLPKVAQKLSGPVKILSAVTVIGLSVAAIAKESAILSTAFAQIGGIVLAFNVASIAIAYGVCRAFKMPRPETITISYVASVHNVILAIYIALGVLQQNELALPAAIYSISMNLLALAFGGVLVMLSKRDV